MKSMPLLRRKFSRLRNGKTPVRNCRWLSGKMSMAMLSVVPDLIQLPHIFLCGMTGSGKSVCMNSIILGLLTKYLPTELNFIMADLKAFFYTIAVKFDSN